MKVFVKLIAILALFMVTAQAGKVPNWQKKSGWKHISIYAKANGGTEKDMESSNTSYTRSLLGWTCYKVLLE